MAVGDAYVFPGFLTQVLDSNTTFLSKATDYFSHMLLQKWKAKIRQKEKSPQPGIELTTTRSLVRHAHHWATRAGPKPLVIYFQFWHDLLNLDYLLKFNLTLK